ncbi:M16 family metallopeptidase [Salinimicrobium terrae]|uniref:M16 family metallopeptidase n=1 Tax=Salinimicrobium terrae TaxID=470866 RepID=UPI0004054419|nr:pitrilysin family protein [Salinimicrobium terrae]
MINKLKLAAFGLFLGVTGTAQEVEFVEYTLDNGLDVILHQDNSAPVVTTAVMYDVGGKDRINNKTGFAHFFEHLLFEGTENIGEGEWFKMVSSHGGTNNANTSNDRTYYYEIFPSNNLELGLWMESERMLHPVIKQSGVDTQNEVVKEEKRVSYDNRPYGNWVNEISSHVFQAHPYKDPNIGYMDDLDAATLDEFKEFFDIYYKPNNATLVVAGDIDVEETKKLIKAYFGPIPAGEEVVRNFPEEEPISETIEAKAYDPNIQIPAVMLGYRTPGMTERDAFVLDMVSSVLSDGKSSRLYKKLVDDQKQALEVGALNITQKDYGQYVLLALPLGETSLDTLVGEIDEEIVKLQTELISQREYEKLQNKFENRYVNSNSSVAGIAHSLATYQMLYEDVDLINEEIDIYRSITREEIRDVAKKYLSPNQRVELEYLPKKDSE